MSSQLQSMIRAVMFVLILILSGLLMQAMRMADDAGLLLTFVSNFALSCLLYTVFCAFCALRCDHKGKINFFPQFEIPLAVLALLNMCVFGLIVLEFDHISVFILVWLIISLAQIGFVVYNVLIMLVSCVFNLGWSQRATLKVDID